MEITLSDAEISLLIGFAQDGADQLEEQVSLDVLGVYTGADLLEIEAKIERWETLRRRLDPDK